MSSVEERVDNLEHVLAEYIRSVGNAQMQTEKELRDFKEEMREDRRGMNKKWGVIANKLGTVVEDIVAPNIPRIAQECFKCKDIDFFGTRITKRNSKDKSKSREFDVLAVCDDTVIINEAKSSPKIEYVNEFIEILNPYI
jgi:hypothetical protein